mmetsp:Transcript_152977/g.388705  ORF Transcript_152977/g.388705 Transcript_152977/m.388705 type:complete len:333 (+) Transcript_152977:731-1729(+)
MDDQPILTGHSRNFTDQIPSSPGRCGKKLATSGAQIQLVQSTLRLSTKRSPAHLRTHLPGANSTTAVGGPSNGTFLRVASKASTMAVMRNKRVDWPPATLYSLMRNCTTKDAKSVRETDGFPMVEKAVFNSSKVLFCKPIFTSFVLYVKESLMSTAETAKVFAQSGTRLPCINTKSKIRVVSSHHLNWQMFHNDIRPLSTSKTRSLKVFASGDNGPSRCKMIFRSCASVSMKSKSAVKDASVSLKRPVAHQKKQTEMHVSTLTIVTWRYNLDKPSYHCIVTPKSSCIVCAVSVVRVVTFTLVGKLVFFISVGSNPLKLRFQWLTTSTRWYFE